jgi:hypothetical protein
LIVDEADSFFKNNPELRAIINSGWTRGTGVPRCHPDTHEPEFFETFGPKAIGLKGLNIPAGQSSSRWSANFSTIGFMTSPIRTMKGLPICGAV